MSSDRNTPIAFLGMGLMGTRMAARLIHAGFRVAVWNRTAAACEELLDMGAEALALEKIGQYPVILSCLADDNAVQAVFEQIQPHLQAKQVIVDFSSLSVDKTLTLAEQAARQQVKWIDSPVSGGTAGAEQGTLVIFAGGDGATIEKLTLIYNVLSQRVTRMGASGTGQATKICNQLIVAANSTLIAEAVALAAQPLPWNVQPPAKPLNNALTLAAHYQLNIPVAQQALQQLQAHQAKGFAEADLSTVIQQVEQTT